MKITDFDIIVIGGSSGSLPILMEILNALPQGFSVPIVIVIHRLKNVESDLQTILSSNLTVCEPEDKDAIIPGGIYLAPQNYHLLVENDHTFSMDYSEAVNYSRPSIDVTFTSVAGVYKEKTLAILLSGANKDGADGINEIIEHGGSGIAQDPATAEYTAMPEAAIQANSMVQVLAKEKIIELILTQQS